MSDRFDALDHDLARACEEEVTLGAHRVRAIGAAACAVVRASEGSLASFAHGSIPTSGAIDDACRFDVASVTKVVATTLAIGLLVRDRALALDDRVADHLPGFDASGKGAVTVRELLGHRSGLRAWQPFFLTCNSREDVLDAVLASPLAHAPGTRVYSDLGFLALGALVEALRGRPLDRVLSDEIVAPLGLESSELGYLRRSAPPPWRRTAVIAPTGRTRPREPAPGQESLYAPPDHEALVAGEVDDDNAFVMDGVAGHAGVFATARTLAALGARILEELDGADRLGLTEVLREFASLDPADGPPRGLGFDMPSGVSSSVGHSFGRGPLGAIGHLGFTGCSLWLDRDRGLSVALLTNRTFAGRASVAPIRALRPRVHDLVALAVD
ncbi:MAG: serine hydrolase domain-containing protein [Sandaracinaceae bacterium]